MRELKIVLLESLKQRLPFLVCIAGLFLSLSASAGDTLHVRVERPDLMKLANKNPAWNIVLTGVIDRDAPSRVAEALARAGDDGADVYLSSPGGNLLAGMEIGRIIRRAGANTYLGVLEMEPSPDLEGVEFANVVQGSCYSACALAFLGGVYRYGATSSKYGVHRFYTKQAPSDKDFDAAQVLSAAVAAYIREMGADPKLFDLVVEAGQGQVRILSPEEQKDLRVVNHGRKAAEWIIEVNESGHYLRGSQETAYGEGKALFVCFKGAILFMSFYEVGSLRAREIVSTKWEHSLFVNGVPLPLREPSVFEARNSYVHAVVPLEKSHAMAVASSQEVGHAMQLARDAPTFIGYRIEIETEKDQSRVQTYIRNCYR